jgi:four helix bundle protein
MAALESFRDRGFRFALAIVREYRLISTQSDLPRHLRDQMLRAGTSVGANLAEARSASSRRDLVAKNAIALREARECRFWLRLIEADQPDLAYTVSPLLAECQELIALLTSAVRRLKGE